MPNAEHIISLEHDLVRPGISHLKIECDGEVISTMDFDMINQSQSHISKWAAEVITAHNKEKHSVEESE